MGFRRQGSERHARRHKTLADAIDRLDLFQADLRADRTHFQQVAQLGWAFAGQRLAIVAPGFAILVTHSFLKCGNRLG